MKVVAEGVETAGQLEALREQGCDHVQGYIFGRPMPASEVTGSLQKLAARRARKRDGAARQRRQA